MFIITGFRYLGVHLVGMKNIVRCTGKFVIEGRGGGGGGPLYQAGFKLYKRNQDLNQLIPGLVVFVICFPPTRPWSASRRPIRVSSQTSEMNAKVWLNTLYISTQHNATFLDLASYTDVLLTGHAIFSPRGKIT